MFSPYLTGLFVAIVVVAGTLGLIALGQQSSDSDSSATSLSGFLKSLTGQDDGKPTKLVDLSKKDQTELLNIAKDPQSSIRLDAILALIGHEDDLGLLVPELARLTMDRDQLVTVAASIVLNKIGPQGAAHLRPLIESSDPIDIAIGCTALKELGGAEEYLPQMRQWLGSADSQIRKRSLYALQGSPEAALQLMNEVILTLDDEDFNVQCMACRVLATLGPDAIDAADRVYQLYREGNPSASSWAAYVLGSIGPTANVNSGEILASSLNAFYFTEKQRALQGLARMGGEASSVADDVRGAMNDPKKRVVPDAAFALWKITGDSTEPLKAMEKSLNDLDFTFDAIELVGQMEETAAPLVPRLLELLDEEHEEFGESIVIALGRIGPSAKDALPAIKKIAKNPANDGLYRYYAREAIARIEKP